MGQLWVEVSFMRQPNILDHLDYFRRYVLKGHASLETVRSHTFRRGVRRYKTDFNTVSYVHELDFLILGWNQEIVDLFVSCMRADILEPSWDKLSARLDECINDITTIMKDSFDKNVERDVPHFSWEQNKGHYFTVRFDINTDEASLKRLLLADSLSSE